MHEEQLGKGTDRAGPLAVTAAAAAGRQAPEGSLCSSVYSDIRSFHNKAILNKGETEKGLYVHIFTHTHIHTHLYV